MTVLKIEGDRVQLGFNAPRYVPIWRAEVHRELADALAAAAEATFSP